MFKEYDVVTAKSNLGNVLKGTTGTILILLDDENYIVEFMDTDGNSLNVLTVNEKDIEVDNIVN